MDYGLNTGWTNQMNSPNLDFPGSVLNTYQQIKAAGAQWIRVEIPDPALVDITSLLQQIKASGLKILGLIDGDTYTGFTQHDWSAGSSEAGGGTGQNAYLDGLIQKFGTVAKMYSGLIDAYEVWNEPNAWTVAPGQGGTYIYPSNFAYLLKGVYPLAAGTPVVSGGLFQFNDASGLHTQKDYMTSTISALNGSPAFDFAGIHPYVDSGGHVMDYNVQACINDIAGTTGKPLFVTEFGWSSSAVGESVQQSNFGVASNVMRRDYRVPVAIWFKLQDSTNLNYGLLRSDGSQKPVCGAFQNNVSVEIAAAERWSSFFNQERMVLQAITGNTSIPLGTPSMRTGIGMKWYNLYLDGHQLGPATSYEYPFHSWQWGKTGVAQDFGSWRVEDVNGTATAYGPTGSL